MSRFNGHVPVEETVVCRGKGNSTGIDWMDRPLTVAEGVPPWLFSIVSSFEDPATRLSDSLVAVFYVVMHECGFTIKEEDVSNELFSFNIKILKCLPDYYVRRTWKSGGDHYHFNFVLSSLLNVVKLLVIPFDGVLVAELYSGNGQVLPLAFKIDDYVIMKDEKIVFINLRKLSNIFKNMCLITRDNILAANNLPLVTNLQTFPYELLLKICSFFRPHTFTLFSMTCKSFYETIYLDEMIWKKFSKEYLNIEHLSEPHFTWKSLFIHKQTVRKQLARCVRISYDSYGWFDDAEVQWMC